MRRWLTALLLALCVPPVWAAGPKSSIINSKHDFRATSTATIRSTSVYDACVFCHTPHNANPGPLLWNHQMGVKDFVTYSSTTLTATVTGPSPADSSKLCLSCHDGTIALGSTVQSGNIGFVQGPSYALPNSAASNIAAYNNAGFGDDHPFAFAPNFSNLEIKPPANTDSVKLRAGKVQCISCHDPHQENLDRTTMRFLVKSNEASAICLSCHQKPGWSSSAHALPPDPNEDSKYTSTQGAHTGYVGVSKNGCESCHRPHASQVSQRLVKYVEEGVCFQCHDGSVTGTSRNIQSEFTGKTYKHPVLTTPSQHDASERPMSARFPLPETQSSTPRHAECVDCHDAHYAQAAPAGFQPTPPAVTPPESGAKGQSSSNTYLPQAANEYEICIKCHADSANKPQTADVTTTGIGFGRNPKRQADFNGNQPLPSRGNTRLEFTIRQSFHPVMMPRNLGVATDVPSLRAYVIDASGVNITTRPLNAGSSVYCTDCHNNDTGHNLGSSGTGPTGVHGSNLPHLLERSHLMSAPPATPGNMPTGLQSYSITNYQLCNKCHDVQNSIVQNRSFPEHYLHVVELQAPCATCHDGHSSTNPMLINFDTAIVAPSSSGQLVFTRSGTHHGACYLRCHGHDHNPETY